MGGTDFDDIYVGTKTPREAFYELVKEAVYQYGHGGYSGTIKEKDGFTVLSVPEGTGVHEFIDEKMDENDKWGPAFCVELKGEKLDAVKKQAGKLEEDIRSYIFFGIASC